MSITQFQSISRDILESFEYAPPVIKRSQYDELTNVVKGNVYDDALLVRMFRNFGVQTGEGWHSDCTLTICSEGDVPSVDEESGDVYRTLTLRFLVSWSSRASASTVGAMALVNLYTKMVSLCETLTEKYSEPFKVLVRSAQDEAQRKLNAELAEHTSKVHVLSEHATKGLRVGSKRRVLPKSLFAGVPNGTYNFMINHSHTDSKKYSVCITNQAGYLTRTE